MKKYICTAVTDAFINKICREHPTEEPSLRKREWSARNNGITQQVDCNNVTKKSFLIVV